MPGRLGEYLLHGMDGLYTLVAGSITTVNDAAPTIRSGRGFTVARDGEGLFTFTLTNSAEIVSVVVGLARETLPDGTGNTDEIVACYVDQDTITANAFQVRVEVLTDAGAADPDATLTDAPGGEIHFFAVVGQKT